MADNQSGAKPSQNGVVTGVKVGIGFISTVGGILWGVVKLFDALQILGNADDTVEGARDVVGALTFLGPALVYTVGVSWIAFVVWQLSGRDESKPDGLLRDWRHVALAGLGVLILLLVGQTWLTTRALDQSRATVRALTTPIDPERVNHGLSVDLFEVHAPTSRRRPQPDGSVTLVVRIENRTGSPLRVESLAVNMAGPGSSIHVFEDCPAIDADDDLYVGPSVGLSQADTLTFRFNPDRVLSNRMRRPFAPAGAVQGDENAVIINCTFPDAAAISLLYTATRVRFWVHLVAGDYHATSSTIFAWRSAVGIDPLTTILAALADTVLVEQRRGPTP